MKNAYRSDRAICATMTRREDAPALTVWRGLSLQEAESVNGEQLSSSPDTTGPPLPRFQRSGDRAARQKIDSSFGRHPGGRHHCAPPAKRQSVGSRLSRRKWLRVERPLTELRPMMVSSPAKPPSKPSYRVPFLAQ